MISPLDPLFFSPFVTGLAYAVTLSIVGLYLRLRGEWLASLAFAQISAMGALLALVLHASASVGGLAAAILSATLKQTFENAGRKKHGTVYAFLYLFGWSASILLVVNLPVAERAAHALFDGQLYFTGRAQLIEAACLTIMALVVLRLLSKKLLRAHFFPDFQRPCDVRTDWVEKNAFFLFDLMSAAALAFATMSVGVMAAFALLFIPPLIAFERGTNWARALAIAALVGVLAHVCAFTLALAFDQPYGPLLALLLVVAGTIEGRKSGARQ
jgi:zinc transport system permease protein